MKTAQNHFLIVTSFVFLTYSLSCANKPLQQGFAEDDSSPSEPIIQEQYEPITNNQRSPQESLIQPVFRQIASAVNSSAQDREACLRFSLPAQFKIVAVEEGRKRLLQVLDRTNKPIASIEQNVLTAGKFELLDLQKRVVLTGVENKSKAAVDIDLYDCSGAKMGRIVQDFEKSFVSASLSYSWFDEENQILSQVEKKDEYSREVSITDRDSHKWAALLIEKRSHKYEALSSLPTSQQKSYMLLTTLKLFADGAGK